MFGIRRIATTYGRCMRVNASTKRLFNDKSTIRQASIAEHGQSSSQFSNPPLTSSPIGILKDVNSGILISMHKDSISLQAPNEGILEPIHFDHIWLRDICQESQSVESSSKQKLFHTTDIELNSKDGLILTDLTRLISNKKGDLFLELAFSPKYPVINSFSKTFSSAPEPSIEPHFSKIPIKTLLSHATSESYSKFHSDIGGVYSSWQSKDLTNFEYKKDPIKLESQVKIGEKINEDGANSRPIRLSWGSLLPSIEEKNVLDNISSLTPSEFAKFTLVSGLMRDGLAFVTGLPTEKKGNNINKDDPNSPHLARLAEMFGEIRNTFYGSLWNVRSLGLKSKNIAYTNLDLGLHMDLLYFQNPPRFQFLHMLKNQVKGGKSIFVDSFEIAEEMFEKNRNDWKILSTTPICFEYNNDNYHYRYLHPTFEISNSTNGHSGESKHSEMPRLTAVNYSPPFQGNLPRFYLNQKTNLMIQSSPQQRQDFYFAFSNFANLTHEKRFRFERMLQEGECVIFDNRRILHARRGFEIEKAEEENTENNIEIQQEEEDKIKRWLKGCYIDGDAIWSTFRVLLEKFNKER